MYHWGFLMFFVTLALANNIKNITFEAFGTNTNVLPAAFADFNSDNLIDLFVLRDDLKQFAIMLASKTNPLFQLQPNLSCTLPVQITTVFPGDFNGDAFMDVLVTTIDEKSGDTIAQIFWGEAGTLNCNSNLTIRMRGQPLAIDYNQDMIIDLFGQDENYFRTFWVFDKNREFQQLRMTKPDELEEFKRIRKMHSNAFLNWNYQEDNFADLVVATDDYFEIWHGMSEGFKYHSKIDLPKPHGKVGQSLFFDVEASGKFDLVLPVCWSSNCMTGTIMVYSNNAWHNLSIDFRDPKKGQWGFPDPDDDAYLDTISLRSGDFNMDGYPDLLATLVQKEQALTCSFLLENVECNENCDNFTRTFEVKWDLLNSFTQDSAMAVFYDFYQDGVLDVIFTKFVSTTQKYSVFALRNSLDDDDRYFLTVTVTSELSTNLPGPMISCEMTTTDGSSRTLVATQLPQSAHFSLGLPYMYFGFGNSSNFIETLIVKVGNNKCEFEDMVIVNSQETIVLNLLNSECTIHHFIKPSHVAQSAIIFVAVYLLIILITVGLHLKERHDDKVLGSRKLHRFHFIPKPGDMAYTRRERI